MLISSLREAIQSCQAIDMGFDMYGSLQAIVYFREDPDRAKTCRFCDFDMDKIVTLAIQMRRERNEEQSGDKQWS